MIAQVTFYTSIINLFSLIGKVIGLNYRKLFAFIFEYVK